MYCEVLGFGGFWGFRFWFWVRIIILCRLNHRERSERGERGVNEVNVENE